MQEGRSLALFVRNETTPPTGIIEGWQKEDADNLLFRSFSSLAGGLDQTRVLQDPDEL